MVGFSDRLALAVSSTGVGACVGLDPHLDRLPTALWNQDASVSDAEGRVQAAEAARAFCFGVMDVLAGRIPAVKPQVAFFEALGAPGVQALEQVVAEARRQGLLVVLDAKRGDIGSTARAYARATLDNEGAMGADSVTLSPYLGEESLTPFVPYCAADKGCFVLVRTSNPGAGRWQHSPGVEVAGQVATWLEQQNVNHLGDCGLGPFGAVIGATLYEEAAHWRETLKSAWLLVPGYGAQGASGADVVPHFRKDGLGALVVSARGVLFSAKGRENERWKSGVAQRAQAFIDDLRNHISVV